MLQCTMHCLSDFVKSYLNGIVQLGHRLGNSVYGNVTVAHKKHELTCDTLAAHHCQHM